MSKNMRFASYLVEKEHKRIKELIDEDLTMKYPQIKNVLTNNPHPVINTDVRNDIYNDMMAQLKESELKTNPRIIECRVVKKKDWYDM